MLKYDLATHTSHVRQDIVVNNFIAVPGIVHVLLATISRSNLSPNTCTVGLSLTQSRHNWVPGSGPLVDSIVAYHNAFQWGREIHQRRTLDSNLVVSISPFLLRTLSLHPVYVRNKLFLTRATALDAPLS